MIPKIIWRLVVLAATLYFAPLGVLCLFQRQLVFHAASSRTSRAIAVPARTRLISLRTSAGDTVAAYYGMALHPDGQPDPDFAHRPTLLFFYGNGGSLADCRTWFQQFRRMDTNVLMPEYVGFGQSSGQASETNCYATARAAYLYLRHQPEIDQAKIVIAGYSLGSGVAVDLAARELSSQQPVAGLVLFAAFTSMAEEAHRQYPMYPTPLLHLLLKFRFMSEAKMARVTCPVLIVHSRADHLIPYWMAGHLAAASGGKVTRLTLLRADHAFYFQEEGKKVFFALREFLEKTNPSHET